MHRFTVADLSNEALLDGLVRLVAQDRLTTARMLAHIAEVDRRELYLPRGHGSMFAYCVEELRLSEDAACSRIRAARVARRFPAILDALAEGRVHLTGIGLLAGHLTPENVDELLAAATHRSKSEIEHLLARRFPRPEVPEFLRAVGPVSAGAAATCSTSSVPERMGAMSGPGQEPTAAEGLSVPERMNPSDPAAATARSVPERMNEHEPAAAFRRERITPLAPELYALQVNLPQSTHDKLRHAQDILSHQVPSGDLAQVLERALDALIEKLEKLKYAATKQPRTPREPSVKATRHIPAHVKRAVRVRDQNQCTFVGTSGRRCSSRRFLEFDHVVEVSRGGEATVDGIRLRCRAHNQFTAAQMLGAELVSARRRAAIEAREKARLRAAAETAAVREAAARVLGGDAASPEPSRR